MHVCIDSKKRGRTMAWHSISCSTSTGLIQRDGAMLPFNVESMRTTILNLFNDALLGWLTCNHHPSFVSKAGGLRTPKVLDMRRSLTVICPADEPIRCSESTESPASKQAQKGLLWQSPCLIWASECQVSWIVVDHTRTHKGWFMDTP